MKPVVRVQLPTANNAALPATISGTLTWDQGGTSQTTLAVSWSTSGCHPGDKLVLAVQEPTVLTQTRAYDWSLQLSTPQGLQTGNNTTFAGPLDSGALGAGWSLGGIDRLFTVTNDANWGSGVVRLYGAGEWRFYSGTGPYTSPAGDNGTLSLSGGTYTYQTSDGQATTFNSGGLQTQWQSADGQETLAYRYSGSNQLTGMTAIDGTLTSITYQTNTVTFLTSNNRTTTLVLSGGNLASITNPDTGLHSFAYDTGHRVTGETFGGLQNSWAYRSTGQVGTVTWGSSSSPSSTVVVPAVVRGLTTAVPLPLATAAVTDANGHTTSFALDWGGRPTVVTAAVPFTEIPVTLSA
jgi:YD repeat-containing protein